MNDNHSCIKFFLGILSSFSGGSKFQFANTMESSTVVVVFVIAAFGLATAYQCSNNVLTDADRDFILNLHNSARSNVAKGRELNGPSSNTATVPGAKNMYKLVNDLLLYSKIENFYILKNSFF